MAANGYAQKGQRHPEGHWGKYRGVKCFAEECEAPAKSKGMCMVHYAKARWAAGVRPPSNNPVDNRERTLRYRYGIDLQEYGRLLAEQQGVCAVCKQLPKKRGTKKWLCVDHCHDSKKVRGLLCDECNLAVGYGKTAETLAAAAEYVRSHEGHGS